MFMFVLSAKFCAAKIGSFFWEKQIISSHKIESHHNFHIQFIDFQQFNTDEIFRKN